MNYGVKILKDMIYAVINHYVEIFAVIKLKYVEKIKMEILYVVILNYVEIYVVNQINRVKQMAIIKYVVEILIGEKIKTVI